MVGRLLGAYKLVKRIGQGGMAAVFLAVRADDAYRKEVAIKLVQLGSDRHELLSRFRNERQTLAGLDHPNVVKLLDGGSTPEGLPFLVMDYVEGIPIDDYCDRHKLRIDERLRLFSKVCEAVQYAHQKSVVHRDLKPCNILVTSDGTPKLLDFGIAKVLNPNPSAQSLVLTQTGTRCMTPAYASPEQMRGKSITTATDIYSLGVVLYELLTGHRPYRLTQHTPADVERAICEQDPETPSTAVSRVETETSATGVPITKTPELVSKTREGQPEKLRRRLRGDLDNIVLKALQKEPERRYRSVAEFLEDITRHLQHLPVKARPSTLAYRASRFVQRHKIEVLGTSAIISVVVAAALFVMNVFGVRERALGVGSRRSIESLNTSQSFTPKGWVTAAGLAGKKSAVSCESIASLKLPDTTIISTQSIAAGSFTPSGSDPIPNLPAFCRVEGTIKPTADSDIRFEVWMPSSRWNRKFRGVGNAGFGGSINFGDMAAAARNGYATASTDTGHRGDFDDAKWALKHPEKVIDWGYRAIHDSTLRAKRIIQAFYGEAPRWSFFEGCSNGGRAGLMEAQRFPEDYDGILAGAPDIPWTLLTALFYNTQVPGLTSPDSYIPASKIPTISTAVLAACDAQDGVRDGIVNDPRQCHFDPSTLLCKALESDSCLTSPQVAQLRKIYAGLRNSKGDQILPGYLPGGEQGEEGWKGWITGPGPGQSGLFDYGDAYLKNLVFDNPAWDYRTVGVERAIQIADAKTARGLDASDPDIRSFQARGGKLILYSGWSEPVVPPLTTTNYYDSVAAKLGLHETEGFVRLYMAPGMQHCYGGPGPNFFGQFDPSALGGNPQQVPIATDPEHNIFTGLEHWVESSVAPGSIIATKFVNDLDPAQGVKMTRPLCPYPQIAKYKGTGDTNDAANFVCTESDVQH
ncbi:MAG TPA: tannase/feruloyl esterase family alpha/beta hydrolase [Terriglobales bacterium]|nr:tannase/feruloyl esterase family alpha/beta hydrolase [Terriglobales bacterium]